MLQPAIFDLRADRHVAFVRTLAFVGYDFSSASAIKLEIRRYNDEPGTALVSLTKQTTDVQGVWVAYAGTDTLANLQTAGHLSQADVNSLLASTNPATGTRFQLADSILLSVLSIRIDKANVLTLPTSAEVGDDWEGVWDIHITPSGGDEDKYAGGGFIVEGGATA